MSFASWFYQFFPARKNPKQGQCSVLPSWLASSWCSVSSWCLAQWLRAVVDLYTLLSTQVEPHRGNVLSRTGQTPLQTHSFSVLAPRGGVQCDAPGLTKSLC